MAGKAIGSVAMDLIHHPFYYILILGLPLSNCYRKMATLLCILGRFIYIYSHIGGGVRGDVLRSWVPILHWGSANKKTSKRMMLLLESKHNKSVTARPHHSIYLVVVVASLYFLWCTCQTYWRNPPQPAVSKEADLGVLVFLAIHFVLPHRLCIKSMNQGDHLGTVRELPC